MSERLAWELQASRASAAIDMAIMRRRALPKGTDADDAPFLDEADKPYMEAFWHLNSCRSFGMNMGPIPWRDILAFAMSRNYDTERFHVLTHVIRAMDDVFLDEHEKRAKENSKDKSKEEVEHKSRRAVHSGGGK